MLLLFIITYHRKDGVIMSIVIGNMKSLNMHYDELWFIMRSMDWFVYEKVGNRFKQYDKTRIKQANYRL